MYALRTIEAPGSLVAGYRAGDEVHPAVIESWGLVVGEDVAEDRPDPDAPATTVVPRPDEGANRAAWEAYALANGMSADDVAAATQEDLEGVEQAEPAEDHPRPAATAKKSEWVLYVNDHPQATAEDQAWAGDDTTTRAQLQEWQPLGQLGDPVAVEATERANG